MTTQELLKERIVMCLETSRCGDLHDTVDRGSVSSCRQGWWTHALKMGKLGSETDAIARLAIAVQGGLVCGSEELPQ